jgi:hypothetical protein
MKSTVVMIRPMQGIDVRQDSKTMFFNANDLLDVYNATTKGSKRLQSYFANDATKRFMSALLKDEILNSKHSSELETEIVSIKRGKYGGTWMHPYLFIDFAMWLSPEFKVTVIKWVYDNLIKLRLDAGDTFKDVNAALFESVPNSPPHIYSNEAKMVNKLVFGSPDRGQRNKATEQQLSLLKFLQNADVKLINQGLDYYDRYEKLKELKNYV